MKNTKMKAMLEEIEEILISFFKVVMNLHQNITILLIL